MQKSKIYHKHERIR